MQCETPPWMAGFSFRQDRHPDLFRHPLAGWLFRAFGFVLRTDQPKARLRMTEYRDVVSATMIYDSLPINDIFRKVDDDSVLGVIDLRFSPQPFFFVLRREGQLREPARNLLRWPALASPVLSERRHRPPPSPPRASVRTLVRGRIGTQYLASLRSRLWDLLAKD